MLDKLKGAWKSMTLWFNALVLALMPYIDNVMQATRDNLPAVSQWLTADILKGAAVFILVANIALRFRTTTSLADKK